MDKKSLPTSRRKELCKQHGLSDDYVYQCLAGIKNMATDEAVRIERLTNGEISRSMLRRNDYWLHWPDLPAPEGVEEPSHATQEGA